MCGHTILCPGPGHTRRDRSLSVTFVGADEPIVYSFAGDDWRACKDHVARLLGLPAEIGPRQRVRVPRRTPVERTPDQDNARRSEIARDIWQTAKPAQGTLVETYLASRGIELASVPNYGGLRWHPRCPWQGGPIGCVVARFTDIVTGEPRGIHRRPIDGQKPRTLGPMGGCVIRLWPDDAVSRGLVLGEGIETTAAAAVQIIHRGTLLQPAWATGCANTMRDFPVLPGIEALTILVDHDASGAGQAAADACARRWLAAGREVIRLTPKMIGTDFNDIIKKGAAA